MDTMKMDLTNKSDDWLDSTHDDLSYDHHIFSDDAKAQAVIKAQIKAINREMDRRVEAGTWDPSE